MGAAHPDLVDLEDFALSYPEAFPTRCGLGKHGWRVTLFVDHVPDEDRDVLLDFVEESYRAVATKMTKMTKMTNMR